MTIRIILFLLLSLPAFAQKNRPVPPPPAPDTSWLAAMEWRNLGPFRGGRSCAVAGVPDQPNLFYFGATGGGVWRTTDGGRRWENISDGFFGGSIGAIAVSEYDPNVIYVGGGEKTVRGNVSFGYGVWKSEDAGKTWKSCGLDQSRQIARIRIHPRNPDLVYAAVLGNVFAPSADRGVYRSADGGKTWQKILFANDAAGAVDICFDPTNPRILFASTWRARRNPYSFSSGGEGSKLWKSTDGGDTWTDISQHEGLPKGDLGIIGVTVSPARPDRVWAIVEAEEGGVFRSENGGKTWTRVNAERSLRQRAWYYTRIYAHPSDPDQVYVMNVNYHHSKDGGKTFSAYNSPHGDHHDLWIAPENPHRMIIADDGGAQVTYDGGATWSTYHNQPTGQFYRVTTDDHFPYRIYAAQQDNSTIRILHRSSDGYITEDHWEETAGCECGHLAPYPPNPDIVFGGCYGGLLERRDHRTGFSRNVNVWPDNPMGAGAEAMKYRFQWNFPIFFSPHDPEKLYTASNHLHASYDQGQSWQTISPDLTRNDPDKLGSSGGPITQDNTSVEYYCTIFAAVESPRVKDLLWTGSDDGLVHVSTDGGKSWSNVTPPGLPEFIQINSIEADPHTDGGLYLAATMYKWGDFHPYLYKTKDYGKTWTRIDRGIAPEHFTRVVRADPAKPGMLYAGTESGAYFSPDDGQNWYPLQLNLPVTPITDMTIKKESLICTTQGRGIWMIDDLSPLRNYTAGTEKSAFALIKPSDAYRMSGYQSKKSLTAGANHPGGVSVYFFLGEGQDTSEVSLEFLDEGGNLIRKFSTKSEKDKDKLRVKKGANRFVWDTRYPEAEDFEGMILWWASLSGPKALPGKYAVRLTCAAGKAEAGFRILQDPRSTATPADLDAHFTFQRQVVAKLTEMHQAIGDIRQLKGQLAPMKERMKDQESYADLLKEVSRIDSALTLVEETLYQTKNRSSQDPLNFPIRLNNKLAHLKVLMGEGDYPPTAQALEVRRELEREIDAQLAAWRTLLETDIPRLNRLIREREMDYLYLKDKN